MILISAGLVLAAVVLLIAGFVLAAPHLIMWSIVVSVLSAMFLVIGAFLRRHELFPSGGSAGAPATPPQGVPHQAPLGQTRPNPVGAPPSLTPRTLQQTATVPAARPPRPAAGGISPDALVLVIPGRKRYHVPGCRQLIGRDHEELTYEEAREEGFTPCTACLPDAALGGRQLPPVADPEAAVRPSPVRQPPAAVTAESRAESPEATRELRPPAPVAAAPAADATPKSTESDSTASTPSPAEPDPERLSGGARAQEPTGGWFARAESPAEEPVEPEATVSGRAGQPATPGPTPSPETTRVASAEGGPSRTASADGASTSAASGDAEKAEPSPTTAGPRIAPYTPKPAAAGDSSPESDDASTTNPALTRPPAAGPSAPGSSRTSATKPESAGQSSAKPEGFEARAGQASAKPEGSEPRPSQASAKPESSSFRVGQAPVAKTERDDPAPAKPERESAANAPKADSTRSEDSPKVSAEADREGSRAADGPEKVRPGTVKVIVGTRRYHSTACPLIRGAGDTGVETMSLGAAEAAGLTSCSVCQYDRESVS